MKDEKGQVVLILVLVMTVALAIGISVIQRSLSDISTASKVEQSSRAFSAAEAGIEKALNGDPSGISAGTFDNQATATTDDSGRIPAVPAAGNRQDPLEYRPLAKEEVAHVWLADPDPNIDLPNCTKINLSGHDPVCYKQNSLDVYWGDPLSGDKAALELTLVYYGQDSADPVDPNTTKYRSKKWYFDNSTATTGTPVTNRTTVNNFTPVSCASTTLTSGVSYQCKTTISSLPSNLMLIRARLLYNTTSQPFAAQAAVTCPASASDCRDYSIPPQARKLTSIGTAGTTQRKVQVFRLDKVVPPYFDYAIFSAGQINKQ